MFAGTDELAADYLTTTTYVPNGVDGADQQAQTVSSVSPSADVVTTFTDYTARGLLAEDTVTITSRVDSIAETSSFTAERTYDGVADRLSTTTYPDTQCQLSKGERGIATLDKHFNEIGE